MEKIKIDDLDFSHCLRIEYTKYVFKQLVEDRRSINLFEKNGNGKTRLLKDIQQINYPGLTTIYVNLKDYLFNHKGLLNYAHEILHVKKNNNTISKIFDKVNKDNYYILFIDNYDAILQELNMDSGFNEDFFNDLNAIKDKPHVSLLCTTQIPHNNMLVYIGGQKTNRNSWLTLEKENLPKLSYIQIEKELERQLNSKSKKGLFHGLNNTAAELIKKIQKSKEPYSLLCFFVKQLNTQTEELKNISIKKRLKKWSKNFNKQKSKSLDKYLHLKANWINRIYKASGLDKLNNPIVSIINKIISAFFRR